ncbi:MAG: hypothetical protein KDD66_01455 [Bdellovibrionales bacterium]|nr:hypothetical protein [Bdellovibrionales bacterium]
MSSALLAGAMPSKDLTKALVAGELSAEELQEVAPQALYIAIQQAGLEASRAVLPMLSSDQYRALLDFEVWNIDRVDEDKLWDFLSTVDEEKTLEPLGQFLDNVDHELLAMIVSRYVEAQTYEEPTDESPGKFWHTPDRGFTWIHFNTEDPERYRLLGRIMAIIFAAQPELFYQLIAMPMSATPSELEEEAYQLKIRRLGDIGIPEHAQAAEMHAPLNAELLAKELDSLAPSRYWTREGIVALAEGAQRIQPLSSMIDEVLGGSGADEAQSIVDELTYIANCSAVYFSVPFHDHSLLSLHIAKVHGAINVGLERIGELCSASFPDIFSHLGLAKLYRAGLFELFGLRDTAANILRRIESVSAQPEAEQAAETILACVRESFPLLPMFFTPQGFLADEAGKLPGGVKAITSLAEVRAAKNLIIEEFAS